MTPVTRATLSQQMQSLLQEVDRIKERLALLERDLPALSIRVGEIDGAVQSNQKTGIEQYERLQELLNGAVETIDHLANSITLDEPLQVEIRQFLREQREAKTRAEEKAREDAKRQQEEEENERERRAEVRRVLIGVLATATIAIGTYLVKQVIPRVGNFIFPIAVIAFVAAAATMFLLAWTGARPGGKNKP